MRKTRQEAINAHCKKCIHDSYAKGNWRQQVTLCPSKGCELYQYRPKSASPIPLAVYVERTPKNAIFRPQTEDFTVQLLPEHTFSEKTANCSVCDPHGLIHEGRGAYECC